MSHGHLLFCPFLCRGSSWGLNFLIYSLKPANIKSWWAAPEAAAIWGPALQADARLLTAVCFAQDTFFKVWGEEGGGASCPYFTPVTLTECVGNQQSRSLRVRGWKRTRDWFRDSGDICDTSGHAGRSLRIPPVPQPSLFPPWLQISSLCPAEGTEWPEFVYRKWDGQCIEIPNGYLFCSK